MKETATTDLATLQRRLVTVTAERDSAYRHINDLRCRLSQAHHDAAMKAGPVVLPPLAQEELPL